MARARGGRTYTQPAPVAPSPSDQSPQLPAVEPAPTPAVPEPSPLSEPDQPLFADLEPSPDEMEAVRQRWRTDQPEPEVGTIRAIVVNPASRIVDETRLPRDGAETAAAALMGAEVITDLDLDDPGERALVDAQQDRQQTDWWIWRTRAAPVERRTPQDLVNTAVVRMVFDPGEDAPIGGIGVIAGYDPQAETWRDTSLSLEEAREAVTWHQESGR